MFLKKICQNKKEKYSAGHRIGQATALLTQKLCAEIIEQANGELTESVLTGFTEKM